MGFTHVTHGHDLSSYQDGEKRFVKISCNGCEEVISGPVYRCDTCEKFILHQSCFELPKEVNSPLHPHHPLFLLPKTSSRIICNGCRNLSYGFVYSCLECEFNLDVGCAFPTEDGKSKRSSDDQSENLITEIEHFLHSHNLFLFYSRKQYEIKCQACNLQLSSNACYGCLNCSFFLHKSCLQIPKNIQHPYHPHSLEASGQFFYDQCSACKTRGIHVRYRCFDKDGFNLHIPCAINSLEYTPPLKHKCHHNHDLYCCVPHDSIKSDCKCNHCDQLCEGAFYKCFQCDFNIHLKCIPIPPKVDDPNHWHPLTLKDSFCEDDSGVYYCYACEKPRNANFPVYWCEECPEDVPYVAHVECIEFEEDDFRRSSYHTFDPKTVDDGLQIKRVKEERREEEGGLKEQSNKLMSQWHKHPLILNANEGMGGLPCDICKREIKGDKYICELCSNVHFHPSCAAIPGKITSPLHIHGTLHASASDNFHFICGVCKTFTGGYRYKCDRCDFAIEVKCFVLSNDQYQDWKEKHPEVRIRHISHRHELTLVKDISDVISSCRICQFGVTGSAYCCFDCDFLIHESCCETQPQIQQPYHPEHLLIAQDLGGSNKACCVCERKIFSVGYSCNECQFYVHCQCGTKPTSVLKHRFHQHSLYSFSKSDLFFWKHLDNSDLRCYACSKIFSDSFYRCLECNLNVHLECIPLPKLVKHSDHCDSLTLMSSMCEDDSGVHYCNVCLQPRNPNHPVYWCQECEFAAHVGCVIQEGDTSLEVISWEDPEPFFGSLFDDEAEINDQQ